MKILEVRPEQVICQEANGNITTRPNSPYYSLKYFTYGSKRIAYTFSDKSYIMETFDDRIFNCWHDDKRIQFRQDLAEKLSVAINHHKMYGNIREFSELFDTAFAEIPNWDIIDLYLKNVNGLERTKEGFVIYDDFLIDFKGNAWVRPEEERLETGQITSDWNSLCIVMQGTVHNYMTTASSLPDEFGNFVKVNAITMTIITKIMFLLNPHLEDEAFVGQLSKKLKLKLSLLSGGE